MEIATTRRQLTHLPVEGTHRSPTIDYSSLSTLADCQWRWYAKYVRRLPDPPSVAMRLGSMVGEMAQEFWAGRDWQLVGVRWLDEWREENPDSEYGAPEWLSRGVWMMERYEEMYGHERAGVRQVGAEVPFRLRLPGRYGWLTGRIDELWMMENRLWVVERKTGKDFRKVNSGLYEIDPQTTLYFWAARELGYEPWGICLDFLRSYKWTRDLAKHPPEDSFRRLWLDRSNEHLENAILEAGKGLTLAKALIGGSMLPLRNISESCDWCGVRNQCVQELAFPDQAVPESFELEL